MTIDHCCLIDLEERRANAPYVEALIDACRRGRIDLAVTAMGATENTKDYFPVETYDDFRQRLRNIGLGDVPEIHPFARFGLSFWGHSLWGDDQTKDLERRIWEILFPNYDWKPEFNQTHEEGKRTKEYRDWVNRLCDVNLILAHAYARREVLITRDKLLIREKAALQDQVDVSEIMTPHDFLQMLS